MLSAQGQPRFLVSLVLAFGQGPMCLSGAIPSPPVLWMSGSSQRLHIYLGERGSTRAPKQPESGPLMARTLLLIRLDRGVLLRAALFERRGVA